MRKNANHNRLTGLKSHTCCSILTVRHVDLYIVLALIQTAGAQRIKIIALQAGSLEAVTGCALMEAVAVWWKRACTGACVCAALWEPIEAEAESWRERITALYTVSVSHERGSPRIPFKLLFRKKECYKICFPPRLLDRISTPALLLYLVLSIFKIFFKEDAETGKKSEADYTGNRLFKRSRLLIGISKKHYR